MEKVGCPQCGKMFLPGWAIQRHAQSHTRCLECKRCGRGYKRADMLAAHEEGCLGTPTAAAPRKRVAAELSLTPDDRVHLPDGEVNSDF